MDSLKDVKVLTSRGHAYLDYVIVAVFFLAPELLGLSGFAETLAYLLGSFHLSVSLFTEYELGLFSKINTEAHKQIELLIGLSLVLLALVDSFDAAVAQSFFASVGVVILIVWALTRHE